MVTSPLFGVALADLKTRLRLTGVETTSDAEQVIDEAILTVRMGFQRRLNFARIAEIEAFSSTANPDDEQETLHALARVTQVKWVRKELLRTLPTLFMDASGEARDAWNEEAPFRQSGPSERDVEVARLDSEIEANLQILAGEDQIGDEETIQVYDGTPDLETPRIGDTLSLQDGDSTIVG
jgi:hypothetical protein